MFLSDANVTSTYNEAMIKVGDPTATRYADIIGYTKTGAQAQSSAQKALSNESARTEREFNDTVEISEGVKLVNLARGFDLAEAVRNEKDPDKVRELIKSGSEDINRIGTLFGEVARSLQTFFGFGRS